MRPSGAREADESLILKLTLFALTTVWEVAFKARSAARVTMARCPAAPAQASPPLPTRSKLAYINLSIATTDQKHDHLLKITTYLRPFQTERDLAVFSRRAHARFACAGHHVSRNHTCWRELIGYVAHGALHASTGPGHAHPGLELESAWLWGAFLNRTRACPTSSSWAQVQYSRYWLPFSWRRLGQGLAVARGGSCPPNVVHRPIAPWLNDCRPSSPPFSRQQHPQKTLEHETEPCI